MTSLSHHLPAILLALAVVVGVPIAYRVWAEAHEEEEKATEADVFADLERAYHAGEIDEAEFRRVQQVLGRVAPDADDGPAPA